MSRYREQRCCFKHDINADPDKSAGDYQNSGGLETRDDKALLAVCEKLPGILSASIENPVVSGQWLDEGWSPELRAEFVSAAHQLHDHIRSALATGNAAIAVADLRSGFGSRFPDDPKLVSADTGLEIKAAVASPSILVAAEDERVRRAQNAASEVRNRGQQSRPWSK